MFHLKEHLSDQKAILPDEIIDQMQVATFTEDESGYGIGWSVTEDEHGYRTIQHGGGMGGVNTILLLIPSERIAVAVLANGNTALPWRVTEDILAVLLPDYSEKLAAKRA